MTQIIVAEERVEHRNGMGDCFCCEIVVLGPEDQVLEEQGICEPLAPKHADEAYCARMVKRTVKELRGRWKESLRPGGDFDLASVREGL